MFAAMLTTKKNTLASSTVIYVIDRARNSIDCHTSDLEI